MVDGRVCLEVHGTVQGVGFRPFVYRLARELALAGDVRNAGGRVIVRLAGPVHQIRDFHARLVKAAPPAAHVDHVDITDLPDSVQMGPGFSVLDSLPDRTGLPLLPPDLGTCAACLRELFDPTDRRYRYPFLNCTDCGPRATIIEALPYDRERTGMRGFTMCAACAAEYRDPSDRRFHAEPISCPDCGPQLSWHVDGAKPTSGPDALAAAVATITAGGIIALKGIGGYQLVCAADRDDAVARLRKVKDRPTKPLAVMVADLTAARRLVLVDHLAAANLTTSAAPIMVLPKRVDAPIAAEIAPGLTDIGVFLPYTPLHHLLMTDVSGPLVVTSGNLAGTPMAIDNAEELRPYVDGILDHDRPIWSRYDDSVVAPIAGSVSTIRRARGYAPAPLPLPYPLTDAVLAVGAQLKHTTCLAIQQTAIVGPHTGDLADAATLAAFEQSIATLRLLHDSEPALCAHDMHPGYLSTQYVRAHWPTDRLLPVQHHHAHVAATAAEHGVQSPFVGIALDGSGFGDDGTLWGGEILLTSYRGYRRFARFATAPLPGGALAVRRPARMALGYLFGAEQFETGMFPLELAEPLLARLDAREVTVTRRMIEREVNSPRASSAGRLFDAVAALLGLCDDNSYEGEAAMRLGAAADPYVGSRTLRWDLHRRDGIWVYDPIPTLRDAVETAAHTAVGEVAARFHRTIADVVVTLAARAAAELGTDVVCLGGGVFQNPRLTADVLAGLTEAGLHGLAAHQIPTNDGGISYGQAAIAAAHQNRS